MTVIVNNTDNTANLVILDISREANAKESGQKWAIIGEIPIDAMHYGKALASMGKSKTAGINICLELHIHAYILLVTNMLCHRPKDRDIYVWQCHSRIRSYYIHRLLQCMVLFRKILLQRLQAEKGEKVGMLCQ